MNGYQALNLCDTNLENCLEQLEAFENLYNDNISDEDESDVEAYNLVLN